MALQDFYNTGEDSFLSVDSLRWAGQIFTASSTYTTDTMRFLMYRNGLPGTVTVNLEGEDAGKPDGNVLATGTTDGDTLTTNSAGEWREITWDTPFEVTSGVKYAVYAKAGGTAFALNLRRDVSSPSYAGGTTVTFSASWAIQSGSDTLFEIYGASTIFVELSGTVAATSAVQNANLTIATSIELSGTVAATSNVENANLTISTTNELSGTIAAVSTVGPSSLGSVTVGLTVQTAFIKRLVTAGNNQIWYENI